jgi:hypothetical protein
MIKYILKYILFLFINLVLFVIPNMILVAYIPDEYLSSDILNGILGMSFLIYIVLIQNTIKYQVDSAIGYRKGWALGVSDLKQYLLLLVGK